jgi:hypothetical protein
VREPRARDGVVRMVAARRRYQYVDIGRHVSDAFIGGVEHGLVAQSGESRCSTRRSAVAAASSSKPTVALM